MTLQFYFSSNMLKIYESAEDGISLSTALGYFVQYLWKLSECYIIRRMLKATVIGNDTFVDNAKKVAPTRWQYSSSQQVALEEKDSGGVQLMLVALIYL